MLQVETIDLPSQKISTEQVRQKLNNITSPVMKDLLNLDLECVKVKLFIDKNWSLKKLDHTELLYIGYLFINYKYPNESWVPSKDIDEFWHYHILDTKKYMEDCQNIFGYILHHYPYFGLLDNEKDISEKAALNTQTKFERMFGFRIDSDSFADCNPTQPCHGSNCNASNAPFRPNRQDLFSLIKKDNLLCQKTKKKNAQELRN